MRAEDECAPHEGENVVIRAVESLGNKAKKKMEYVNIQLRQTNKIIFYK